MEWRVNKVANVQDPIAKRFVGVKSGSKLGMTGFEGDGEAVGE